MSFSFIFGKLTLPKQQKYDLFKSRHWLYEVKNSEKNERRSVRVRICQSFVEILSWRMKKEFAGLTQILSSNIKK